LGKSSKEGRKETQPGGQEGNPVNRAGRISNKMDREEIRKTGQEVIGG